MGRTPHWLSLLLVLGFVLPGRAADDKKDSSTKSSKDYKAEFKDYAVVNSIRGKLAKVDKEQLTVEITRGLGKNAKMEKVDLPMLDNAAVFWIRPPVELDEKGKPKKVKPQDRKKPVTGPGGVKGYPAETSDLKQGQIVDVILMRKKTKHGTKDKTENKPSVGAVYIIAEPKS